MPRRPKLVFAWDKSTCNDCDRSMFCEVAPHIDMVKVGLEAIFAGISHMISDMAVNERGLPVMCDAKIKDIGNTTVRAAKALLERHKGIRILTLHARMSAAALLGIGELCYDANVSPAAVTLLTDIDEKDCRDIYGWPPSDLVYQGAHRADAFGINGLVCSGHELPYLRELRRRFTTIVPGIRPTWAANDDQKRVITPTEAVKLGADYIVVGRPILFPPNGMTSADAARRIRDELEAALEMGMII